MASEEIDAFKRDHPEQYAKMEEMLRRRDLYNSIVQALPMTYQLLERCDDDLADRLLACLKEHEIDIIYPSLTERLDSRTRNELLALLNAMRAKPS